MRKIIFSKPPRWIEVCSLGKFYVMPAAAPFKTLEAAKGWLLIRSLKD